MVVSGAIVLKLELVVLFLSSTPKIMLQTFGEIKADPKMPFRAVNDGRAALEKRDSVLRLS